MGAAMPRFYDRVLVDPSTTPPTSRKDMRWTCTSRDGRQDHLRQDLAKPRCYMVSGGGAKETMGSCTGYGLHEYDMEYGLPRALLCGQWGAEPKGVVRSMVHGSSLHKCDVL